MSKLNFNRTFLKDEIYQYIKDQIILGDIQGNDQIKISQLSKELGVSRTPIRDAILMLENEGLVITEANSRTYVSPINLDEISDIYEMVALLEAHVIDEAMEKITDKDIQNLKAINKQFKEAARRGDIVEMLEADTELHSYVTNLSSNKKLLDILSSLKEDIRRIEIKFYKKDNDKNRSFEQHNKFIELLEAGDIEGTKENIRKNWKDTLNTVLEIYDSEN